MGDPPGPPMSAYIYYVGLASSGCSWCSRPEPPEPLEHSLVPLVGSRREYLDLCEQTLAPR